MSHEFLKEANFYGMKTHKHPRREAHMWEGMWKKNSEGLCQQPAATWQPHELATLDASHSASGKPSEDSGFGEQLTANFLRDSMSEPPTSLTHKNGKITHV